MQVDIPTEQTVAEEKDYLDSVIKAAMQKTEALKETDLAYFIPHGDSHLSQEIFIRIKETDKQKLIELLENYILKQEPKKILSQLEQVIQQAMHKVNANQENDLCMYLPFHDGRLHHFTFRRMKKNEPKKLQQLIEHHMLAQKPKRRMKKHKTRKKPIYKIADPLEKTIAKAMKRHSLNLKNPEDLCKFLPYGDSRFHPVAFRSMKEKDPKQLQKLIEEHVLKPRSPKALQWKIKEASPKQNEPPQEELPISIQESKEIQLLQETNQTMQTMVQLLENLKDSISPAGKVEKEQQTQSPSSQTKHEDFSNSIADRYLRTVQNQLIKQIRQKKVDFELWDAFVDLVEAY